jgi:SAM-dependent methyltransferase
MDTQTLAAYEAAAARHAAYQRGIAPGPVHRLIMQFFHPGAPTADIGAGAGRDAAWMLGQGFRVTAYEPSAAMRAEAQTSFPALEVREASLPGLGGVPERAFANVLCNAVLMHLPAGELGQAVLALARILTPGGRLVLSYRGPRANVEREADGRLFSAIEPGALRQLLEQAGLAVLHREANADSARPDVLWQALVAELPADG